MAGMDMEEANVALDVISKCSATMSRNSEKTRSVFKELHHSVSAWSNQQRDLDGEHAEACEKIVKRCDGTSSFLAPVRSRFCIRH